MANNISNRPMIIDTPSGSILFAQIFRVRGIRWVGATTAGHLVQVTDQADLIKWASVAAGANQVESDFVADEKMWNGLKVPTLQSGVLYIEIW